MHYVLRDHAGLCLSGTHQSDTHPARHTHLRYAPQPGAGAVSSSPTMGVGAKLHSTPCFSLPLDGGRAADMTGLLPQAWGRDVQI